jgi:hypothetical protein
MAKVKIEWNFKGFDELRKSPEMVGILHDYAQDVYSRVSGTKGYVMEDRTYPERAGVAILAKEYPAIKDNYKNNSLLKAVGK